MNTLQRFVEKLNLTHILLLAFLWRLIAVFFSPGFAFSDDHFEIIEIAKKWMDHQPITPPGEVYVFSLIYPGMHYLLFEFCQMIGISSPEGMLFAARLLHALVAMLTVYYGYKLTLRLCHREDTALLVALCFAIFWLFPFMSVRNLREFFCVPFLMIAFYHATHPQLRTKDIAYAAFFFLIAFCIRYQALFFPLGVGLFWLFNRQTWQKAIVFGICCILFFFLTQGLFDTLYWGKPFASLQAYIDYNAHNSDKYPNGPWFQYLLTVAGLLLLPACFLFFVGYGYSAKRYRLLFVASLVFFIFHSYFPNKQERFILPFIPFILLLGIIGYQEFYTANREKRWVRTSTNILLWWMLILNTAALLVLSTTYTKRSRVEAMSYLRNKGDVRNFILEGDGPPPFAPLFYAGKQFPYIVVSADTPNEELEKHLSQLALNEGPNYAVLCGNIHLKERIARLKSFYPNMVEETSIAPSLVDNIAYVVNPSHNVNETWYIYRLNETR